MNWIVISPDKPQLGITADDFARAVAQRWGEQARRVGDDNPYTLYQADIHPPGDHPFLVNLATTGSSASTDGTWAQAADFAAWIRSLLPADFPGRLWLVDQGYSGHAELPHGITAEEVRNGWLDHATHGEPDLD